MISAKEANALREEVKSNVVKIINEISEDIKARCREIHETKEIYVDVTDYTEATIGHITNELQRCEYTWEREYDEEEDFLHITW